MSSPYRIIQPREHGGEADTCDEEQPRVVVGRLDPDATRAVLARLKIVALMWAVILLCVATGVCSHR